MLTASDRSRSSVAALTRQACCELLVQSGCLCLLSRLVSRARVLLPSCCPLNQSAAAYTTCGVDTDIHCIHWSIQYCQIFIGCFKNKICISLSCCLCAQILLNALLQLLSNFKVGPWSSSSLYVNLKFPSMFTCSVNDISLYRLSVLISWFPTIGSGKYPPVYQIFCARFTGTITQVINMIWPRSMT